ncbi:hypothetical protein IEQ34_017510 [Dendrobium chrysotoxum]|uniref:Uncharacterized protein n=1 Tax=Dendrobium chrysotoxum TaxID=161865 RepID=A0AAV7GAE3_DENCH|nr:hypothetical protein IEQ34_017510 [Dendrobium chrysotoxum]
MTSFYRSWSLMESIGFGEASFLSYILKIVLEPICKAFVLKPTLPYYHWISQPWPMRQKFFEAGIIAYISCLIILCSKYNRHRRHYLNSTHYDTFISKPFSVHTSGYIASPIHPKLSFNTLIPNFKYKYLLQPLTNLNIRKS